MLIKAWKDQLNRREIVIWIYLAPPMAFIAGLAIGKLHERIEWNKLIKEGVINAPNLH